MDTTIAELSPHDLEALIGNVIDKRMQVWLTQLLDAVGEQQGEDDVELNPDFEASLQRALQQAQSGQVVSLDEFRKQLRSE